MSGIFISDRRNDFAAGMTDRLYDRLSRRWPGRVFMDIDSLAPGDVFPQAIEENLISKLRNEIGGRLTRRRRSVPSDRMCPRADEHSRSLPDLRVLHQSREAFVSRTTTRPFM
jgi:hypothetical protein